MRMRRKRWYVLLLAAIISGCLWTNDAVCAQDSAAGQPLLGNGEEGEKEGIPKVTVDSVTWSGGLLELPVDLGDYKADGLQCRVEIYSGESSDDVQRIMFPVLTGDNLAVPVAGSFESCERKQLCAKRGTYAIEVEFLDNSTYETIATSSLDLVVPLDSSIWQVSEETLDFDGSRDIVFHFKNGTNYYQLQSITSIQIFTGKGDVGAPYPVMTEGFKADMEAGTLTIDRDAFVHVLKEYVKQGGHFNDESDHSGIRKVFINVSAVTAGNEEIQVFNRIEWKDNPGGTTTAWGLDITKLNLGQTADPSDPSVSRPVQPETVTLSSAKYIYNGKVRKPSVTVKDSNGQTIGAENYTVTYPAGCKNVGRYTVKITFKGNYTGNMEKTFEIKPKGTSVSSVKAGKKSFTVKWKKQAKQTTGYQIQYSTNKKFKSGNRTALVNKSKTTQRKITGLKAKKKYYVRIRTYKTVKVNGKSVKLYSNWSKAKSVTIKKQNNSTSASGLVPLNKLSRYQYFRKYMTDQQLKQAYNAAVKIVKPLKKLSKKEKLTGVAVALRNMFDSGMSYSMTSSHYDDPYGYLILKEASCAGCARTTGLCLDILGISYEHVQENQYAHQWARVKVGKEYWICDPYGLYCGPEPAVRKHPYL